MAEKDMQGQYAGFISRATGLVIDIAVVFLTIVSVSWLTHGALSMVGINVDNCPVAAPSFSFAFAQTVACRTSQVLLIAFAALTPSMYFILFWSLGGQTIGDYMVGVKIVRTDGGDVGFIRALIRWLAFLLCVLTIGIGFLWVIVDDRREGWHDKLARTCVVYAWQARMNESRLDAVNRWLRARQAKRGEKSLS